MTPRHIFTVLLALAALAQPLQADPSPDLNENTPLWLRELSNLPTQQRQEYTYYFKKAKEAYATARISECLSFLNSCELIYNKNPNVWSLRASALVAQRRFDEAKPILKKVLEAQPDDEITLFNSSLISLGEKRFEDCRDETTALLNEIRHTESVQLVHSLKFRLMLCYLMLGQEEEAQKVVADIGPLDDSPLYYYAQAAMDIYHQDAKSARRNIASADRIYAKEKYLLSYKQNLSFSQLEQKYLTPETKEEGKEPGQAPADAE